MQTTQSTVIDKLVGNDPELFVPLLRSSVSVAWEKGTVEAFAL